LGLITDYEGIEFFDEKPLGKLIASYRDGEDDLQDLKAELSKYEKELSTKKICPECGQEIK